MGPHPSDRLAGTITDYIAGYITTFCVAKVGMIMYDV